MEKLQFEDLEEWKLGGGRTGCAEREYSIGILCLNWHFCNNNYRQRLD